MGALVEQGMDHEGLPGQLRAWMMESPSTGESNFIQAQLRQTSDPEIHETSWSKCLSAETHLLASPACEMEPSVVKTSHRGHRFAKGTISRTELHLHPCPPCE